MERKHCALPLHREELSGLMLHSPDTSSRPVNGLVVLRAAAWPRASWPLCTATLVRVIEVLCRIAGAQGLAAHWIFFGVLGENESQENNRKKSREKAAHVNVIAVIKISCCSKGAAAGATRVSVGR